MLNDLGLTPDLLLLAVFVLLLAGFFLMFFCLSVVCSNQKNLKREVQALYDLDKNEILDHKQKPDMEETQDIILPGNVMRRDGKWIPIDDIIESWSTRLDYMPREEIESEVEKRVEKLRQEYRKLFRVPPEWVEKIGRGENPKVVASGMKMTPEIREELARQVAAQLARPIKVVACKDDNEDTVVRDANGKKVTVMPPGSSLELRPMTPHSQIEVVCDGEIWKVSPNCRVMIDKPCFSPDELPRS